MKKLYGLYNGCYWLCIATLEEAFDCESNFIFFNLDYIQKSLEKGHHIFVNEAGGFHAGCITEKTDFISKEGADFPTEQEMEELQSIPDIQ